MDDGWMESTGVTVANVDRLGTAWRIAFRSCYFRNTPNPADLDGLGGWIFYRRLFAEYIASGYSSDDGGERVQHYITTTSKIAGRNLVPFFEIWGFPIAAATRTFAAAYPAWTTNPMLTWKPSAVDPNCMTSMRRRSTHR
ncbi:hypothetical protein HYH03_012455 [Edaphochlamys debaryana]|uniref:Peptidase M60 domain-containing protein n=1 Tax=Edaphochlamys debaryana TaxID=47281 RepID=A0A835XQ26_9CHLO|nr:hypothetical protein HYH03_012455 [Edaphochlamys debaryana]|eukprot:KAG2489017.1 hypothetical protein HYH03_012455 [Edaphochlamys debaryana]